MGCGLLVDLIDITSSTHIFSEGLPQSSLRTLPGVTIFVYNARSVRSRVVSLPDSRNSECLEGQPQLDGLTSRHHCYSEPVAEFHELSVNRDLAPAKGACLLPGTCFE